MATAFRTSGRGCDVSLNAAGIGPALNLHLHPVNLDHASRVLKCLASAGRSGCFHGRAFIGAGADTQYQFEDAAGTIQVRLLARASDSASSSIRKLFATLSWARAAKAHARQLPLTCINVHGLSTLLLGVTLKRHFGCKLIYDTHELESKAIAIQGVRRLYSGILERVLIHRCDAVVCVSDGIADWYANRYAMARPLVVRNVPDRRSQVVAQTDSNLRQRFGLSSDQLLFLYQGNLVAGRQVEHFIKVFATLAQDRHLIFMGRGALEPAVRDAAARFSNIHLCPAVPPSQVLAFTAQADVGLVGMENTCLNHYLSLPNKFFEYLSAGVPVIIPDFPEMRRVVDRHGCGWVFADADGLVSTIQHLSPDEVADKRRHASIAGRELAWEKEEPDLLQLYRRLLS